MSTRGTRGRGRGRGKSQSSQAQEILEAPVASAPADSLDIDFSPPEVNQTERTRKPRLPARPVEDLRKTMEIVKNSISDVCDHLENAVAAESSDIASLRRIVLVAIKHLKQNGDRL